MIEIFFCLVLHTQCSILISKVSNEIKNSTTTFSSLVLYAGANDPFFLVDSSNITISRSEIVSSVPVISSTSSSFILLTSIHVSSIVPPSLVHSTADTITLEGSNFNDLVILGGGTFVSSGIAQKQKVIDCSFRNISRGVVREGWGITEEGVLENCVFEKSEDTFYGFIITGPTVKTLSSFDCFNSTFARCTRIHNPPYRLPPSVHRRLTSATCTTSVTSDCERSSTTRLESTASTITFTRATFTDCTSSGVGGGIYLNKQDGKLTLVSCTFTSCTAAYSSNDGGGGAVDVDKGILDASSSNFTRCSSKTYGGAIYLYLPSTPNSIASCIFCENTASTDAPDVCFYQKTAPSNPFSSCLTYNAKTYTSGYYYGSYTQQTGWLQSSGTTCPSDSGGGGGGEEGDDIDDVTIDECSSDPSRTPYKRSRS